MLIFNDFQPDWVCPPGESILEALTEQGLSIHILSNKLNISQDLVAQLISGEMIIDIYIAEILSLEVGGSAQFWLNLEFDYRSNLDRVKKRISQSETQWLNSLPVKDMKRKGWIPSQTTKLQDLKNCLNYFFITSINQYKINGLLNGIKYRASDSFLKNQNSIAAWVRQGEIKAQKIECNSWNKERFIEILQEIRKLTFIEDPKKFIPDLVNLCSECGVALVIERTIAQCPVNGVTKFISENKALILLSMRYLQDDIFWFTFFHEAAHLVLHNSKEIFIDFDQLDKNVMKEEKEADAYAEQILIPESHVDSLMRFQYKDDFKKGVREIKKMSNEIGISSGIIVGQMQYRKVIPHTYFNQLKKRFDENDVINIT